MVADKTFEVETNFSTNPKQTESATGDDFLDDFFGKPTEKPATKPKTNTKSIDEFDLSSLVEPQTNSSTKVSKPNKVPEFKGKKSTNQFNDFGDDLFDNIPVKDVKVKKSAEIPVSTDLNFFAKNKKEDPMADLYSNQNTKKEDDFSMDFLGPKKNTTQVKTNAQPNMFQAAKKKEDLNLDDLLNF